MCLCLAVELGAVQAAAVAPAAAGITVVLTPSPFLRVSQELLQRVDVLVVNEHQRADLVGRDLVEAGDEPDWDRVGRTSPAGPRSMSW